jgi:hypothetical protein
MQCQRLDPATNEQCENQATRRVIVEWKDPPKPGQRGYAGTIYMAAVCDDHDPDPTLSRPL